MIGTLGLVAALLLTWASAPLANDEVDELMPGRVTVIKTGKLAKFVAKADPTFDLPDEPANDPRLEGGTLAIFDVGGGGGSVAYDLPVQAAPLGWRRIPSNDVKPLKGFKYRGTGSAGDPCKVVLVKAKVVKAICKGDDVTLSPPFAGDVGIVLSIGTNTKRYCATFGGDELKNDPGLLRRKNAPPPGSCPFATTTTTSTSTTSSTIGGPCCGGFSHLSFTTGIGSGTCGTILSFSGSENDPIECGGLYFGGGQNGVPLPAIVPDLGQSVSEITTCTGQIGTLGPATSLETGSNLNCTAVGCLFGAPLPIPNPGSTPTSVCVINSVTTDLSGTTNCSAGEGSIDIPLDSQIFLTGDLLSGASGIQPCPRCTGGTCEGGVNDGSVCTPQSTDQGGLPQYPTSHDCLPDPLDDIGTIPIAFALSTGTVEWTASPASNPTSSTQNRVFCGYCRDADFSLAFDNPFQQCWENGAAIGPACAGTFEACQQRDNGAFGPSGGGAKTIRAIGQLAGSIVDGLPHTQKLVSVFCIPPTFNDSIDAASNLPGPGATALEGDTQLCSTANPCP